MAEAKRDNNFVPTALGTSNADGTTPLLVQADPTNHGISALDDTTGSDLSGDLASRDNNRVTVIMAVSETDGTTPVAVYIDSATGKLLIDST